jgi:hypothetical protein
MSDNDLIAAQDADIDRADWGEAGVVTHQEAREILNRFIFSHYHRKGAGERARFTIPADPKRDDDLRLLAYIERCARIEQAAAVIAQQAQETQRKPAGGWIPSIHENVQALIDALRWPQ